jgi:ribonuclease HI
LIGAAAVLYRNGKIKRRVGMWLGSKKEHTVAEAEAVGMVLGLELLRRESNVKRMSMAVDNMSAIQRATSTEAAATQWIWDMFQERWNMVKRQHRQLQLTIRWVPGHEGVAGNKEADRLAKMAVEKGSSDQKDIPAPLRKGLPQARQPYGGEPKKS